MTDKQIIDVTQCPYYKEDKTCTYLPYKSKCEGDCNWTSYKEMEEQLKRSEAQCEAMFVTHTDLEKAFKAKEQECNQLKAENGILKEKFEIAIKNNIDKTLLRLENGDVKEELQEIRDEFGIETLYCHDDNTRVHRCIKLLQLKDCLTEIKEFVEKDCKLCFQIDWFTKPDDCGICDYKQILQKIREVIE